MLRGSLLTLIGCVTCGLLAKPAAADSFQFRHEHVLGTSCEIKVWADSLQQARQVESTVLREVDRLQRIFSSYDQHSELMRWQRGEVTGHQLSPELVAVLRRCEFWRTASQGAFDVRAGELGKVWRQAAQQQQEPRADQLQRLTRMLSAAPFTIHLNGMVDRHDSLAISLDALAKGYILDAACQIAEQEHATLKPTAQSGGGLSVMIGGDLRMIGTATQQLSIANPFDPGESSCPIGSVQLINSIGLATSGGYRRYYEIEGVRHSHILDPRTGQSAASLAGVSVIAPTGMDADAAATAVSVLGPVAGLQLIEQMDGYAALVVLPSGEIITSNRWGDYAIPTNGQRDQMSSAAQQRPVYVNVIVNADDKDKPGLFVKFTLGAAAGGRYHRPYVAVWLEDKDGFPVKTNVLWLQTSGPGPRWHRDLTKWFSNDQMRKLVEQKELIGTISGATRGAGEYETRFDGTDNDGKPLKPGKYALCLEAAREHGTHQFVREAIEWGDKPIAKKELKPGTEFSAMSYRFVPGAVEVTKGR